MKNCMKLFTINPMKTLTALITAAIISLLSLQISAEEPAKSTIFTVNGMVCAFCAQGIEKKLSAMSAIQSVHVSLEEKIVVVEAKPGQTIDTAAITAEIKDAGYDVTKVETVERKNESR